RWPRTPPWPAVNCDQPDPRRTLPPTAVNLVPSTEPNPAKNRTLWRGRAVVVRLGDQHRLHRVVPGHDLLDDLGEQLVGQRNAVRLVVVDQFRSPVVHD